MNFLPIRGVAGALLLASFAGCAACGTDDKQCPNPAAEAAPKQAGTDCAAPDDFACRARNLAEKLCRAFARDDASGFLALLPENLRKEFHEEAFRKARKKLVDALGEASGWQYVTTLRHPLLQVQLWKIAFGKPASDGSGPIVQEAVFQVVIGEVDGKPQVVSFGFL